VRQAKLLIAFLAGWLFSFGQQMPYFTQFRASGIFFNPALTGTKRFVDLRLTTRSQWVGFDGQPKTQGFNLNSRLYKGKLGLGMMYFKDVTGPTQRNLFNMSYAFHIKYPDIELSFGFSTNFYRYFINGSLITLRMSQDKAIDKSLLAMDKFFDMSAGAYLYNDRFHIGLCALNLIQQSAEFYENVPDSVKKANLKMVPHPFFTFGYNWSEDPDFVWENSLMGGYVSGATLTLDYSLRIILKNKVFVGASFRLKDAIGLQAGFILFDQLQVAYSYDIGINQLRKAHNNTHEVTIIYSSDLEKLLGRKNSNSQFKREKFQYMF